MTVIADETLMAYADGELSPAEQREFDARLASDPRLRERLEPFKMTGTRLSALFDEPMRTPVPQRLLIAVDAAARSARIAYGARAPQEGSVGLLRAIGGALGAMVPAPHGLAGAFAVSTLLLAVGGAAGWMLGRGPLVSETGSDLVASGALERALETAPSGKQSESPGVWPVLSFRSVSKEFCRQYAITDASGQQFAGFACRTADGRWRVAFHTLVATNTAAERKPAKPNDHIYEGASGPWVAALDQAIEAVQDGDAFGKEDETAALASQWTRASK
jgi:surface antigen